MGKGPSLRRVHDDALFPPVSFNTQEAFVLNTLGSVSKCGRKRGGVWGFWEKQD